MNYIALLLAGAFLCNSIPHLTSGLQGIPFPTPFAKPRGVGDSSPLINFLWGTFNFWLGLYLLCRHPVEVGMNQNFIALSLGALVIGIFGSFHFGKVRSDKSAKISQDR